MTLGDLPRELENFPRHALAEVQGVWRVLQLRQAQRLAAEVLFGWMEIQILGRSRNLSSQIVDDVVTIIEDQEDVKPLPAVWIRRSLDRLENEKEPSKSYLQAAKRNSEVNFFDAMADISAAISSDRDYSAFLSLKLLLLCAAITRNFEDDEYCKSHLNNGGASRVSLAKWSQFVFDNAEQSTRVFLLDMFENYFLSQHFGIAAARYTEGKQRLRITIEEGGLVSMLPSLQKAWHPNVTRDRLAAVLSLMAECRLIHRETADGEDLYVV
jgi:hypothetical protein